MIPFGSWLPDLPVYVDLKSNEQPHCVVAQNCVPNKGYFQSLPSVTEVTTSALGNRCQGAASFVASSLTAYLIAGDSSKLYHLIADNTFDDVSKVGGYATPVDGTWTFTQLSDTILATNYADTIQSYVMGVSTDFADLAGSPPVAKYLTNILNYILAAFTGDAPFTIHWCDQNDATNWATGDARVVVLEPTGGQIKGIVGGEYGVIFRDKAIHRMNFIGPPQIFEIAQVETQRGCYATGSIAQFGSNIFYLAQDGFFVFDGNKSIPIGNNIVNNFFFSQLSTAFAYKMKSAVDIRNSLIILTFPDGSAINGTPNRAIIYNYTQNEWSYVYDITAEYIFSGRTVGYTIDSVDAIFSTIDSVPYSFDSDFWAGGNLQLNTFTSNHRLGAFLGSPLTATFETAETAPNGTMNRSSIPWIQAVIQDGGSYTISMGVRNTSLESVTYKAATSPNVSGLVPISVNDRLVRAKVVVTGGFSRAQGVELVGTQKGAMF